MMVAVISPCANSLSHVLEPRVGFPIPKTCRFARCFHWYAGRLGELEEVVVEASNLSELCQRALGEFESSQFHKGRNSEAVSSIVSPYISQNELVLDKTK